MACPKSFGPILIGLAPAHLMIGMTFSFTQSPGLSHVVARYNSRSSSPTKARLIRSPPNSLNSVSRKYLIIPPTVSDFPHDRPLAIDHRPAKPPSGIGTLKAPIVAGVR